MKSLSDLRGVGADPQGMTDRHRFLDRVFGGVAHAPRFVREMPSGETVEVEVSRIEGDTVYYHRGSGEMMRLRAGEFLRRYAPASSSESATKWLATLRARARARERAEEPKRPKRGRPPKEWRRREP